jgi:hypothetical protein
MSRIELICLFVIAAGIVLLILIRMSGLIGYFSRSSGVNGPFLQRVGARYFGERSWKEIAVLAAAPLLWVAIIWLWGWWHGW